MTAEIKRIVVCGLGNVGKDFIQLVGDRKELIETKYNLTLKIVAIAEIGGVAVVKDNDSLPIIRILEHLEDGGKVETFEIYGQKGVKVKDLLESIEADALIETTPTNLEDGEPAKTHIMTALKNGMDVISANKGPLVLFYKELNDYAKEKGKKIYMSAATAAALPTLDVGIISTAGAKVTSFEGILNGTTNYILSRMHKDQCSYEEALKEAQKLGIAESNPKLDVEGYDTSNKIVLIANKVFDESLSIKDVERKGITEITFDDIAKAKNDNKVIKLVGTGRMENCRCTLRCAPKALEMDHPLSAINYSEKAISFVTDTMGRITVSGGKSSPRGAAAALLKDIIHSALFSLKQLL